MYREEVEMLRRGDQVPHFDVKTVDGARVSYASDIWQRRHLVLVVLPDGAPAPGDALAPSLQEDGADDVEVVVTRDRVGGVAAPGVLVADRWGEIVFATASEGVPGLPDASDIAEWVGYVRMKCPECEGEAR